MTGDLHSSIAEIPDVVFIAEGGWVDLMIPVNKGYTRIMFKLDDWEESCYTFCHSDDPDNPIVYDSVTGAREW